MRNILKLTTIVLLFWGVFACDTDRFPKNRLDLGNSLNTIEDAEKWNTGIVASFRARQYGLFTVLQDIQADQYNATADFGNRMGAPHGWQNFNSSDYDLTGVWSNYYSAMKNINSFLELSQKLDFKDDADKAKLKVFQGNAHFVRAYYYFNLAIRYGAPYKAASASSDLSVPLVKDYNVTALPKRSTNKEVYDFILSDIAQAKVDLASVSLDKTEITANAVLALEARVKLYMSDWEGAYAVATELIKSNNYPLVAPTAENIKQMWRNDNSTEDILQLYVSAPDELTNVIAMFGADASKGVCRPDWLPTQWMIDLYADSDLRKSVYFDANQITEFGGISYRGISVLSKFMGNPDLAKTKEDPTWGYIPDGRQAPKVFRIAEAYLIAAEAGYMANRGDAIDYLNALRKSRGLSAISASGSELLKEIKLERTRELAYEGFRLWDLRRWDENLDRKSPQLAEIKIEGGKDVPNDNKYAHLEKGPNGYYTLKIGKDDPKWIWPIPSNDVKVNPNL